MWTAILLLGVWAVLVPGIQGQAVCPLGWLAIDGRCFLSVDSSIVFLPETHDGRRLFCQRQRGDLAKFDPPLIFQPFLPVLVGDLTEFYIGLTDREVEGEFRWVSDGTTPTAVSWGVLPNGGVQENCVVISGTPPVWSDTSCDRQLPFICERPAENTPCGAGQFTQRIVGGNEATPGSWPWQGSIGGSCGATLISQEWAITAAHCLGAGDQVFFGDISQTNPTSLTRQSSTVTWFIDPRYDAASFAYDLAWLYLHTPVTLSSFVQPACVYSTVDNPATDASPPELDTLIDCVITGWGDLIDGGDAFPDRLQEGQVTIFPPIECASYGNRFQERIQLCAGDVLSRVDACQGDSGGPLICRDIRTVNQAWTLAGVVSFGDGCALPGFPGVYTRVLSTRSFVDMTRTATTLARCATSGKMILEPQLCNNIVDCEDYSDELGCARLESGQTVLLESPKWNRVTNFINREWIYFPQVDQSLTLSFSLNTIPGSGSLTTTANLVGALPQSVPSRDPQLGNPFNVLGSVGQPVLISMNKQTRGNIAGFQVTVTSGA